MSLTSTKQCMGTRNGTPSRKGSRDTQRGDCNGDCGNSRFANSSFVGELTSNLISHLSITQDGPRSNQLTKILKAIPYLCQDNYYYYITDIISTNTEPTQEYFLSDHLIKRRRPSKHHVKLAVIDQFIGLDVLSGNSPTNSVMVESTPISNMYPQVPHHPHHNQNRSPDPMSGINSL